MLKYRGHGKYEKERIKGTASDPALKLWITNQAKLPDTLVTLLGWIEKNRYASEIEGSDMVGTNLDKIVIQW